MGVVGVVAHNTLAIKKKEAALPLMLPGTRTVGQKYPNGS
jgi:hypothetical protein